MVQSLDRTFQDSSSESSSFSYSANDEEEEEVRAPLRPFRRSPFYMPLYVRVLFLLLAMSIVLIVILICRTPPV